MSVQMPDPAGSSSVEFQDVIVKRDGNRPISFSGQILAKVSSSDGLAGWSISAVLYKARGGKFVSALSKSNFLVAVTRRIQDLETADRGELNTAQVFDTLDSAVAWFRPGSVSDALRKQLGLDELESNEDLAQ